ncbi:MAG: leucine-rich repeat protein [Eubacterium sp.]|nr:leucine-rich repeat protein [Eubacterium sp.]
MRAFADNEIETLDLTNCALLTTAYQYAFCGNENLISVDMTGVPMEELSQSMFAGCYSLKEFKISKYSRIISTSAFAGDKELENIDLSKIAKYESTSFDRCEKINVNAYFVSSGTTEDGYVYNEFKNHISLIDYNGESTDLNIPDNINGKPVTDIVWKGNRILHKDWTDYHISGLKLPSNLEFIASHAFEFKRVSRTELPKTLSFIGESAFSDARFTSYELNDGLEYVLSGGLPGTLEDLEIPDSVICYLGGICANPDGVTTFGKNVRTIKAKLRSDLEEDKTLKIRISPENPYFCFENGVLYNGDKTEIYRYYRGYNVDEITNNYQIPETVKKIDDNAFQDCNILSSLTIPSSVEYIGNYAFDSSTLNGALTIPQNVKYIGTDAFRKTGLTSAHFADGFKTERLYCTFFACKSLQTVTFGDVDIKALVETYVDSGIKNVEIPDSVEKLSSPYRMTDLSSVTELQLPKNLKYIGGAFEGTKISITELTLPEGLKSVGPYAFAQCKKLKSIDFSNVDFLERASFLGCDALESVDLTGITYIKEKNSGTFSDCPNLKKITFNRTDKGSDIEESTNENNDGVETVVIGNGIKNVKSKAFADCKNLETAVISDSVENIADDAFENCRKLTIVCTKNSNAMLYAQKKGINYKTFKINPIPDKEYTGREIRPELNVTVGESRLAAGKDYSVSYRDNINVGTAKAIAVGLGDYSIYASTVKFNIIPHQHKYTVKTVKPTYEKEGYTLHKCSCGKSYKTDKKAKLKVSAASIKKLSGGKKAITVNIKEVKNISGYQIQFSTSKSFKTKKTVSVSNPKTVKKKIKNLKAKKKYFVRIRAYKKVSKKTYYSSWSKAKSVKTK